MSNYNNLKTAINANIKQNGNQEITGPILNSVMNQMVNILGTGYQFAGVATLDPATDPGTPDAKVFYIANGKGTYTNFGSLEVTEDEVVVLYYDTEWHKVSTGIASQAKLSELESQAIYDVTANNDGATFASLSALLSSENLSTLIPSIVRFGGMSIRFVQSDDNNYVQFRYIPSDAATADTFTNVANWQGVDSIPTAGSQNLVTSGGVAITIPSDSISDNYIINKYVKSLWFSPSVDLTNVAKVSFYKDSTYLIIRLKNAYSTVLYEFRNNLSYPGTFVDTTNGFCLLKSTSYAYAFMQIDFTGISNLTVSEMPVHFNAKLVSNIQYNLAMLQWASNYGGASFEVVAFKVKETSKRISTSGQIVSAGSSWCYTEPIQLNKGDMVYVNTDGNSSASVMSKYDNGTYTNIISYDSNANNSYYYICKESMSVAFSLFVPDNCCIFRYSNNLAMQLLTTGIEGKSAYQSWLDLGNTGTEQDFINSLQGKDGVTGPQGPAGPQGVQGNSGYAGEAGELKVVNNTMEGGATAALSAEAGKNLGNLTDYNAVPVIPCVKNPKPISFASIDASAWTSDSEGQIVSTREVYDFVHRKYVKSVATKILTTASSNSNKIYTTLSSSVDVTNKCVRFSLLIDENVDLSKLAQIRLILGSGGISSDVRCTSVIWTKGEDVDHTFGGIVAGCINPILIKESSGYSFDVTSVTTIGFQMIFTTPVSAEIEIDVIQLDIVDGLSKPGVVLIVDNFESSVVDMAEYAATKGVKLNLSIIPNWIGGASASLAEIQRVKRLGHLIFNHTWNHNTGSETYAEISEGIFKADNWMVRNGMARGSKFVSNPSAYYNNIRYKAQMDSEALVVYHNWTPYPNGETGNGKYLITYPYYPAERFLNICGLDWNDFTSDRLNYFKALAEAAITNKGIAVIGFHDAAWGVDGGVSWKAFIDYVAEIQGMYFYGIDEIVEGLYC